MIAQGIVRSFSTLRLERQMVREGGSPLPLSSWLYIILDLVVAPLSSIGVGVLIVGFFPNVDQFGWQFLWVVISFYMGLFISKLIAVTIFTLVKWVMVKKRQRYLKEHPEEQLAEKARQTFLGGD